MYPRYRKCPHATAKIDALLQESVRVMDVGMSATDEQRAEAKAKEREILERIAKIDPVFGERLMPPK